MRFPLRKSPLLAGYESHVDDNQRLKSLRLASVVFAGSAALTTIVHLWLAGPDIAFAFQVAFTVVWLLVVLVTTLRIRRSREREDPTQRDDEEPRRDGRADQAGRRRDA